MISILLPEEPAYIVDSMKNTGLFDKYELTEEDSNRANMYLAESKREEIREKCSEEDFLMSL